MSFDALFLVGRILFGGYFVMSSLNHFFKHKMMSGYAASKGIQAAGFWVAISGLLILFGGLGVLLGVYVRVAVLLLVLFLVPVSFVMHAYWKDADPMARAGNMVNFTKNMALLGASLMMLAIPEPWAFSF